MFEDFLIVFFRQKSHNVTFHVGRCVVVQDDRPVSQKIWPFPSNGWTQMTSDEILVVIAVYGGAFWYGVINQESMHVKEDNVLGFGWLVLGS